MTHIDSCWTAIQWLLAIFIGWFLIGTFLLLVEVLTEHTNSSKGSQKKEGSEVDEKTRLQIEIEMLEGMAKERRCRLERAKGDY